MEMTESKGIKAMRRRTLSCLLSLILGCALGCSKDPSVGCFYVEIAPAKFIPVKFNDRYRTDMKMRYRDQTVVFKLPWGRNSAQTLMEFEGKLYVLALDASHVDRSKWPYLCFRQDGKSFVEIPSKEFPRSVAILNIWRPGDSSRYATGTYGEKLDHAKTGQALDPEDVYFVNSYQARLWYMLEVTNSLFRAEREFGGQDGKNFLKDYIAKYKPVHLTSLEMKPVPKEDSDF